MSGPLINTVFMFQVQVHLLDPLLWKLITQILSSIFYVLLIFTAKSCHSIQVSNWIQPFFVQNNYGQRVVFQYPQYFKQHIWMFKMSHAKRNPLTFYLSVACTNSSLRIHPQRKSFCPKDAYSVQLNLYLFPFRLKIETLLLRLSRQNLF
jgi:hypothetical protein